jgi:1,2-diacylglycerol 3-alpha-glucosyltransferase
MVLAEAMTAGVPVVALDAPGASDVVTDGENGRLLGGEDESEFAAALAGLAKAGRRRKKLSEAARDKASTFSLQRCADQVLDVYQGRLAGGPRLREEAPDAWNGALRLAEAEWQLWNSRIRAVVQAVMDCL